MEEKDEKHHDFTIEEIYFSYSQTEKTSKAEKTGTRSYFTCQECGKSFNQHRNFKVHMRLHTGDKPFSCQQCEKTFTQKGSLKDHMRIHTGEKPYTCKQCGKSFTHRGTLNAHENSSWKKTLSIAQSVERAFHEKRVLRFT